MFTSLKDLYKIAEENSVAIGAFNTNNLEETQAIVSTAEKLNLPAIIQTSKKAIDYAGLSELFAVIKTFIDEAKVPLVVHLDHAKEIDLVEKCLKIGYRSVMFDGSEYPFEKNVTETRKVVELASHFGATVEGEIGTIGKGEEGVSGSGQKFTDPEEAAEFVKLTGVDSLAISIGNTHGAPKGEKIDFELLDRINQVVKIPLVLHGSSGLSPVTIKKAISLGVRKINIDTQLRRAFKAGVLEEINDKNSDIRDYLSSGREEVGEVVERYLKIVNNIE
ncbi:MAG: fructose-bisphosphate aldolase, class II [Candidatus Berkelbacteria bacterium Athens1014_28]|uniref:Fructose-bisphosphate aldolase, class II n=1 Tax=Candidatus Berkelbacteria bacterium Athens1014_28 TaxID=2017145 RepID=A0A554LP91_9BACT|nr:MAG: fructose-bisphosphate aldolase, class II [Candidatus Berkelbacteria bacterium Athens1014_28]